MYLCPIPIYVICLATALYNFERLMFAGKIENFVGHSRTMKRRKTTGESPGHPAGKGPRHDKNRQNKCRNRQKLNEIVM